jgi:hypothetical protein
LQGALETRWQGVGSPREWSDHVQTTDKFIAFIDILGDKNTVLAAEAAGGDLARPFELRKALGSAEDAERIRLSGHSLCPAAPFVEKGLRFEVTRISDCVVVSAEVSPAGLITLISHCATAALRFVQLGALCRGAITRGSTYHEAGDFAGAGYLDALDREKKVAFRQVDASETGTPFIELAPAVVAYAEEQTDACVRTMFGRMTCSDGRYTAIDPFRALASKPAALIEFGFDPQKWKDSVSRSLGYRRLTLAAYEAAELEAPQERDRQKVRHYKKGLEQAIAALEAKDARLDDMIATGRIPYGSVL